jgi:hypothetical protein
LIAAMLTTLADVSPWLGWLRLVWAVPLCMAIAIVYKTLRLENLRRLPISAAALTITILLGMAVVGIALLALHEAVLASY